MSDKLEQAKKDAPEKDQWKFRPPYSMHDPKEFKARYEASCHCGKVKYQLSREEPLDSKLCHCTTCQTQHAAPFQWAAIFHKEDINFLHGHHDLEWYDPTDKSIEHKLPCKVRCSFCHSPIMDEGRNMILLFPSLVHLKTDQDKANFKPRCHMFYGQRVMDIPDGLPKWSGISGESDLIEDSPPEQVREHERKREEERKEKFDKGENNIPSGAMKRKQASIASSSRKRSKQEPIPPPVPHPHGNVDSEVEYKIKNIIDEKGGKYLIDWEDDEVSGVSYEATWEPKGNANKQAIVDWNRQQSEKLKAPPITPKRGRGRSRKLIDSSPEVPPTLPLQQSAPLSPEQPPLPVDEQAAREPEIVESQQSAGAVEADSPLFEPTVEPSDPPSSLLAGAYQTFTSPDEAGRGGLVLPDAQPVLTSDKAHSIPVNFAGASTRVVPDSQSAIDFSSSAPAATTSDETQSAIPAVLEADSVPDVSKLDAFAKPGSEIEPVPDAPHRTHQPSSADSVPEIDVPTASPTLPPIAPIESDLTASVTSHVISEKRKQPKFSVPEQNVVIPEAACLSVPAQDTVEREGESTSVPEAAAPRPSAKEISQDTTISYVSDHHSQVPSNLPEPTPVSAKEQSDTPAVRASLANSPTSSQSTAGKSVKSATWTALASAFIKPYCVGCVTDNRNAGNDWRKCAFKTSHSIEPFEHRHTSLCTSYGDLAELAPKRGFEPSRKVKGQQGALQSAARHQSVSLSQAPNPVSSLVASEHRSPSFVPAVEPLPFITQDEMNTSERFETLLPPVQGSHSEDHTNDLPLSGVGTLNRTVVEGLQSSASYVVPIGVFHHQRDLYQATVRQNEALIERFLASSGPDTELANEAEAFVERMRSITRHPDLDNADVLTQYEVDAKHQAQWDVSCSAKFRFLQKVCDTLRDQDQDLHIVIVAQPSRLLDMLATFLTNIGVWNRRLADCEGVKPQGLAVTLVSVDDGSFNPQFLPVDLVIAMDPTASGVCTSNQEKDNRSMHVTLAIPGTVDHVEQSVSPTLAPRARLRALVSGIHQYYSEAGKLAEDQLKPDMAAQAIAEYLVRAEGEWPLATLGALTNLQSQAENGEKTWTNEEAYSSFDHLNTVKKRAFGFDESDSGLGLASKKARYDLPLDGEVSELLPTTINPSQIEMTHVSDSVHKPTQPSASADAETATAQRLSQMSEIEQHLHISLTEAQDRLNEHIEALSEVQFRLEEQREKLIEVTNSRDGLIATAQQAVKRMTETANKSTTLKAERTELKQQLDAANAKLLDHSVPERAEFEALRLDAAKVQAEKELLEKRLQSANQENEYSREMYQTSSQSATNFASQNTELVNQLAVARNTATGEQAKLRQMGYDAQTVKLREEIKKLRVLLTEREAGLKVRDVEIAKLKEASRGRMGTRGTSVPRVRSPVKEVLKGWGSRQGSPAIGEGKGKGTLHPLRQG
ncbi:hypothetical protein LTR08_004666 [Meristemomyces frigidus]|nr:hypothetical protein LTR08_004666 [Meristemomyces frigidus]